MKKKKVFVFALIMSILVTIFLFTGKEYKVHAVVQYILEENNLENCRLIYIEDYNDIRYYLSIPEVSKLDVDNYIDEILSKYEQCELTDEFVLEKFNCRTTDEFYDFVYNKLIQEKKIDIVIETRNQILNELIRSARFKLDKEEILEYSLEIVEAYEAEAILYNMSLEDYCKQVLNMTYEDFFDMCYEKGEQEVKKYLVLGVIANNELNEKSEDILVEDIYLEYQNLENKVYDIFVDVEEGF